MRYEAKNNYFKQIAHVVGNFKNIAKTVAIRHQRLSCYYLLDDNLFLGNDITTGKGKYFNVRVYMAYSISPLLETLCQISSLPYSDKINIPGTTEVFMYVYTIGSLYQKQ